MLLVTCMLTIWLFGQSGTLGIKGGINIATLVSKNSGNSGAKISYHAGALTRYQFTSQWSIQPEVLYSKQGIRQSLSGSNYDINLDYINVPLLFQLLIKSGFRVQAGPQIGFLLSAKNIYLGVERDIKSNYKNIDFSFPIGLSWSWPSGFGIDGRWVPGLNEIIVNSGSAKNSVFQFGVNYQLSRHNKK